jgi:F0F1-type ATP synthase membrane subunit c/vacuolar-type H+-ATPase subunit K
MRVSSILKFAFVASVLVYGLVAFLIAGAPDWSRPVIPAQAGVAPLFFVFLAIALGNWVAGFVFGSRVALPAASQEAGARRPRPETRFIIAAALIEAGAICGLVLSILTKDSRPALFAAAVSAILLLMTPASEASPGQT